MSSTVKKLEDRGLIKPVDWLGHNTVYETVMGSVAFGVADEFSDYDITGFCIPLKETVFPHLAGEIEGYCRHKKRFKVYQQHHIHNPDDGREYDLNIYNIVHYFSLCAENNPNMLDSLFSPRECVLTSTHISEKVRENRHIFLHKGSWPKYKGYAYSQLHKMQGKNVEEGSKRDKIRKKYGYDVKFAYHTIRLLLEAEMILTEGTIEPRRHKEMLKSIRRGQWPQIDVMKWAADKEKALERAYENSTLPWGPRESEIKNLLIDCLEHHYGSLNNVIVRPDNSSLSMKKIATIVEEWVRGGQ